MNLHPVLSNQTSNNNNYHCCGFVWQGLGSGGAIRVASVRSSEKLPPCLTEPMPASSKMDPPLAKAKPISNGSRSSVVTYLRRGKTCGG